MFDVSNGFFFLGLHKSYGLGKPKSIRLGRSKKIANNFCEFLGDPGIQILAKHPVPSLMSF